MKKRNLLYISLILLTLILLPAQLCLAQAKPGDDINQVRNVAQLPGGTIADYLGQILGAALALCGSVFLCLIIYGGFTIMTAGGNEDRVSKGKKIIYWAVIGVLIIGASYAITSFIFEAIS